jgi:pantetheine-phosphate adenylyltransferase
MSTSNKPQTATKRIAVYSGTFDPITLGHEDVARRAAGLFDTVIIAVAAAHHKKTLFNLQDRIALIKNAIKNIANVTVMPFEGLIMDFCKAQGATAVVRGIRNVTDFDYEAQMASMNRKLLPSVETIFLLPSADVQPISSTLVREISKLGGDVRQMVSSPVALALMSVYQSTK